jgi:hypothetical protein
MKAASQSDFTMTIQIRLLVFITHQIQDFPKAIKNLNLPSEQ